MTIETLEMTSPTQTNTQNSLTLFRQKLIEEKRATELAARTPTSLINPNQVDPFTITQRQIDELPIVGHLPLLNPENSQLPEQFHIVSPDSSIVQSIPVVTPVITTPIENQESPQVTVYKKLSIDSRESIYAFKQAAKALKIFAGFIIPPLPEIDPRKADDLAIAQSRYQPNPEHTKKRSS